MQTPSELKLIAETSLGSSNCEVFIIWVYDWKFGVQPLYISPHYVIILGLLAASLSLVHIWSRDGAYTQLDLFLKERAWVIQN